MSQQKCLFLNPLKRDGTSQNQRLLKALLPTTVPVDERGLADMLVYAQKYAALLRYYTPGNSPSGNWVDFIADDVSSNVALLGVTDYQQYKKTFDAYRKAVEENSDATAFAALLKTGVELAQQLDRWFQHSERGMALHTSLQRLITSVLKQDLADLLGYVLALSDTGISIDLPKMDQFSAEWGDLSAVAPKGSFTAPPTNDELETELRPVRRNIDSLYKAIVYTVDNAESYLQETLDNYPQHQPHMALLLAFLQLFRYAQEHLNGLSAKHLDFYYHEILQMERKSAQPDQVHLIFELAKQLDQHRLQQNTFFKAGKDAAGKNLFYASDDELVINQARLSEEHGLKTVYIDKSFVVKSIHAAPIANSQDGLGAAIEDEDGKWQSFGSTEMPPAEIGFAVASPMLALAEGQRDIYLRFSLKDSKSLSDQERQKVEDNLKHSLQVYLSGAKDWLPVAIAEVSLVDAAVLEDSEGTKPDLPDKPDPSQPGKPDKPKPGFPKPPTLPDIPWVVHQPGFPFVDPVVDPSPIDPFINPISAPITPQPVISSLVAPRALTRSIETRVNVEAEANAEPVRFLDGKHQPAYLEFKLSLDSEFEAVTAYDGAVLSGGFGTHLPMVRFMLKPHQDKYAYVYDYLHDLEMSGLQIQLAVVGIRNLVLENDLGVLNPAKPFNPFGPVPKKGSKFYIGSNEVFSKAVSKVDLNITWGDLPDNNFATHYSQYKDTNGTSIVSSNGYFKADIAQLYGGVWRDNQVESGKDTGSAGRIGKNPSIDNLFNSTANGAVDATRTLSYATSLRRPERFKLFERLNAGLQYGFLSVKLKTPFLHNLYPKVLADAVSLKAGGNAPNMPYTPLITELKLDYSATETVMYSVGDKVNYNSRVEQLFHITPFGQTEIFPGTAQKAGNTLISHHLAPDFPLADAGDNNAQGTLYIGVDKLQPPQNLSVLFQVAESSANPGVETPPNINWSYLSHNRWVAFEEAEILADRTHGLLTSGIIRFAIPATISDDNTILPAGLHWLKASVAAHEDGIARLIAVKPQAVAASFRNEDNDLSHLATALPAESISKLKQRDAAIKKVSQPYASFDGQLPESDEAFYTRVSERLRHKGRAVTIFDYERLVLEQFPQIYKVKCINHAHEQSEFSPGNVHLVVVPDLRNKNAIDPLRPKATVNTLQEIDRYISRLSSDFVAVKVTNPRYEEIKVSFDVAFLEGYDAGFYLNQLQSDIIRFLSPWAYGDVADIVFGGRIHRTWILNHVEEREYVDFVSNFSMDHMPEMTAPRVDVAQAEVQSSSSVLVSAKQHDIRLADPIACELAQANARRKGG